MNNKDACDLWVLSGKPKYGCVFDIMKDAKYKYKLAMRDAIRSYEDQFSDDTLKHLSSKDMNAFWRTWSAKTCKKVLSTNCVDGVTDDYHLAEMFRQKFTFSGTQSLDSYVCL